MVIVQAPSKNKTQFQRKAQKLKGTYYHLELGKRDIFGETTWHEFPSELLVSADNEYFCIN